MKKIIMILMALCLMAPVANAELDKKTQKRVEKQAKTKAKDFEKRGYTIMGSLPIKEALIKHYTAMEQGFTEQEGHGHAKSKNNGRQMCLTNAMSEYATKELSQIKGMSVTDAYGNEVPTESDPEFSRFYAAYERMTQKEIKGELQESFTVMKQNADGTYDFEMFMLVDDNKLKTQRQKALNEAIEESKLAEMFADQIRKYVNKK